MSAVHPLSSPLARAVLCLLLAASAAGPAAGQATPAAAPARVAVEGSAFSSQEFRFRIVFPNKDPKVLQESEGAISFTSADKDETYWLKVMAITLDKEAAAKDPVAYFQEFNKGMKEGGVTLTDCLPGTVSRMPAERCTLLKRNTDGLMLVTRRGGV